MIKTHNKLEVEGNHLNTISVTYVKPKVKLKVNERLKALPLRSGIRQRCLLSQFLQNTVLEQLVMKRIFKAAKLERKKGKIMFADMILYSEKPNDYTHTHSSVQSFNYVQFFATPRTAAHQASMSITNSQSLLKLMSVESVMPSNHLILCHPLLLPPSIFPSIRVFSNASVLCIS